MSKQVNYDEEAALLRKQAAETVQQASLISILNVKFGRDGDKCFFLYGENLQEGVSGFGNSAHEAMINFNLNWYENVNK